MISEDDFKAKASDFIKKIMPSEPPKFKKGEEVKTTGDERYSYISAVIGTGTKGTILTECCMPLVDFGERIGTFYIMQNKLRATG